jgi:tryptophan-rich sensory protein
MNPTGRATICAFMGFYLMALFVQFVGSHFTFMSVTSWYTTLNKSSLTPPGVYFGIVWTLLYLLMSVAATMVWRRSTKVNCRPLRWWLIQLLGGLLWCIVFFGARNIEQGMAIILFDWFAALLTCIFFWRVKRSAGLLIFPLLLWLSFASYLNFFILQHNPA